MIGYFKEYIEKFQSADWLQTLSLLLFMAFFIALTVYVYTRPKNFYKEVSEMPLENEPEEGPQN